MQHDSPEITIAIPALNEGKNIGPLLERLRTMIAGLGITAEVLVIDGGSTDETKRIAEQQGARCLVQSGKGYGGALREAFTHARGVYVITLDADLSHPPELIPELWKLRKEADIVIASRFVQGGHSEAGAVRHTLSIILNTVFSRFLRLPIRDLSSGFRLYRRAVLTPELYLPENFNVLQEIVVRAYVDGYTIREIPLHYAERVAGSSHVSFVKFALSYLPTLFSLWNLRNSMESADYEYHSYFSRHPLQRYWIRRRMALIREFIGTSPATVDIGSGSNQLAISMKSISALDHAERKVRFLLRSGARALQGAAESLPFNNESFDCAVLSQVLPYLEKPELALAEARRVLRKGGSLIVSVPDEERIGWRIFGTLYRSLPNVRATQPQIFQRFSRGALEKLLKEYQFETVSCRYICGAELVLHCQKVG